MKINWKERCKNKAFWAALIPAILVLIQTIAAVFGFELDFNEINNQLLAIINAVFVILAILGIVVDPTTKGLNDSDRAMTYGTEDDVRKED